MRSTESPAATTSVLEPSDEELLAAASEGHEIAIERLYDRYGAQMYGLALRITGDPGLAQDVVQESFVAIWRNSTRFDPGRASARTWMLTLVHHRAIDAIRRRRPAAPLPDPAVSPPAALVAPDVWDDVVARADAARVRQALERLATPQREAIELAYFGGMTQSEIAERTGVPLGTVKSRVRLGLLSLRAELMAMDAAERQRVGPP